MEEETQAEREKRLARIRQKRKRLRERQEEFEARCTDLSSSISSDESCEESSEDDRRGKKKRIHQGQKYTSPSEGKREATGEATQVLHVKQGRLLTPKATSKTWREHPWAHLRKSPATGTNCGH